MSNQNLDNSLYYHELKWKGESKSTNIGQKNNQDYFDIFRYVLFRAIDHSESWRSPFHQRFSNPVKKLTRLRPNFFRLNSVRHSTKVMCKSKYRIGKQLLSSAVDSFLNPGVFEVIDCLSLFLSSFPNPQNQLRITLGS